MHNLNLVNTVTGIWNACIQQGGLEGSVWSQYSNCKPCTSVAPTGVYSGRRHLDLDPATRHH